MSSLCRRCLEYGEAHPYCSDCKITNTEFLIEATSTEEFYLWKEYNESIVWKENNPGSLIEVGRIGKRPVCISLTWNILNNHRVCFWYATSELVDYKLINKWLRNNFTKVFKSDGIKTCDAMNFHHCLYYIEKR